MKQAFIDFFRKTFEFVKVHWKTLTIIFVFVVTFVAFVSCQGLVNFNGSDGNQLLVDSNNTTGNVSIYGK